MSNDVLEPTSEGGTKPVVFRTPTLGLAVRLGELYNQRTGQFLGVQLYQEPQEKNEVVETHINHTDLSIRSSTTLEGKVSLLGINAKLSLEILSGLVDISGSSSYLKDTTSNTHTHGFALALKLRLRERRILFAEKKLGRNILAVTSQDYICRRTATHFVSAITYGGNVIVNLVARRSNLTKSEKLEGLLKAQLDKLKGAIILDHDDTKADIKDAFSSMDDKFDLVIHGDVALKQVPVNPKDLLDTIPKAASLISDSGGVPISVTLQPIPEEFGKESGVYELDPLFVDQVLKAFSRLDDLRSRFSVLVDGAKTLEEFVPELARVSFAAAGDYAEEHGILLHQLRTFLHDYQHGNIQLQSDGIFNGLKKKDGSYNILVLTKAMILQKRHLKQDDKEHSLSQYYPSTLVGLENELLRFQNFVSNIQKSRDIAAFDESSKALVCLSSIDDICGAIGLQSTIPLFIMTPIAPAATKLKPDLAIIQFLAILRENAAYFNDPSNPAHILYVEDPKDLEYRFPNDNKFSQLEGPSLFFGQVDAKGKLSWSGSSSVPAVSTQLASSSSSTKEFTFKLQHKSAENLGEISYCIDNISVAHSFSFEIRAKRAGNVRQTAGWTICNLRYTETKQKCLNFEVPLRVLIHDPDELMPVSLNSSDAPPVDKLFVATFVQDTEARKWTLYLDDRIVGTEKIPRSRKFAQRPTSVELYYLDSIRWWKGEVCEVKAFPYALTEEQVASEVKKAMDTLN